MIQTEDNIPNSIPDSCNSCGNLWVQDDWFIFDYHHAVVFCCPSCYSDIPFMKGKNIAIKIDLE